jgi:FixJ family two-component response regulator
MSRLRDAPQGDSTHTAFQSRNAPPTEEDIREAEDRVRRQEAHVLRLIVQGAPTQSAEDQLREVTATVEAMKERWRLGRGSSR